MTTKPATWFGVYTASGSLVDVTPGQFHAQEIADTLTKEKRARYIVVPVFITAVTQSIDGPLGSSGGETVAVSALPDIEDVLVASI
ncbi:hypothetical protein [Aquamicrobium soli]|uniref:Uncharacterized protein n=1 Tax=Aquamicrobium soli TaxID=1811518 RepID=A0ABV7KD34_9HYPH